MVLPCHHEEHVTRQVQPTADLLSNLDVLHPDVLLQHDIRPADYKGGLVFRSAVESIRGTFIASSTVRRESFVADILARLARRGYIVDYVWRGSTSRHDFDLVFQRDPDYFGALEVKGGEGNSINISDRPIWAREFGVWCHLDGAIVNQPAHGAHAIVNRLTNELVRRHKLVDVLCFKDALCGTSARPCPKYPGRESQIGQEAAPDVFLFPQRVPSTQAPMPPVHSLDTLRLPRMLLDAFGVAPAEYERHVWEVHVHLEQLEDGRWRRLVRIQHLGQVLSETASRPWQP